MSGRPETPAARHPIRRILFFPFRVLLLLRFFLIWPVIASWRRKTRRSLRWRLAASHFAVVLYSVMAIALVGIGGMILVAYLQTPTDNEASAEASLVADEFERLDGKIALTDADRSALLRAMATGELAPNLNTTNVNIYAQIGKVLGNVESISLVDRSQQIIASSNSSLIGTQLTTLEPDAATVGLRALDGSKDLVANTVVDGETDHSVGAYPLTNAQDEVIGAVVLSKVKRTYTPGWPLWVMAVQFFAVIGLVILALVGVPAVPIGIITGIRRARAISRPVTILAAAADRLAQGDLSVRVKVRGQDEVASLQHSFNAMAVQLQRALSREAAQRERAEQALAANRELVANVSHELRTPVAVVRAHLEALQSEPEHGDEYVRIALRETDRLEQLVEDLFALTRLETKGMMLQLEPFDAGSAVREAVESLIEPARRESGLTLISEVAPGDLTALGDRARVVQVIQNLVRNAIRYTPEGGIILVSAANLGTAIELVIRDTGAGIAPEDLPHVFDRFYRAERSRNRGSGGAGLGLTIARQLVEAMAGTISVASALDEGATFTIRLPRGQHLNGHATNGHDALSRSPFVSASGGA